MNSNTARPKPALAIFIPELQFPIDDLPCVLRVGAHVQRELTFPTDADAFEPAPHEPASHDPAVYVASTPQRYCPVCKHWNAGPDVRSTISPQKYFPTSPTYAAAPADKGLATDLAAAPADLAADLAADRLAENVSRGRPCSSSPPCSLRRCASCVNL